MNDSITNRQVAFMIFAGLVAYGIVNLPSDAVAAAGSGAWIPLMLNTALVALFTYFIAYTASHHENQTLFEYSQKLMGKILGKLISLIYILYFLALLSFLVRAYSEVITMNFLQKTPVWAISFILLFVVGYALTKNLKTIAIITEIYGLWVVIGFVFIHLLMTTQGRIVNIKPILDTESIMTYMKASYKLLFPFLGVEVLLVLPIQRNVNKDLIKYSVLTTVFIGLLYIFVVESTISVAGIEDVVYYDSSVLKILKGLDFPYLEFLRRPDGLYIIFGTLNLFSSVCIYSYCVFSMSKKFFRNTSSTIIILAIIAASFILSHFPKTPYELDKIPPLISIMGILTLMVIPSILFIITKVKKNAQQS